MEKVNISELNCPDDVDRYPKGTVFVMDNSEKEMKVPDCLRDREPERERVH
ncbi:MAG: hypothetical protein HDR26_03205 [Lachnospiraceae bacterium]|nr:hypothetical protein [Lachnospiraceae bacterium]